MPKRLNHQDIDELASVIRRSVPEPWIAWLGGIIDGEGCIGAWRRCRTDKTCQNPGYTVGIRIANTDRRMIKKIMDICGVMGGQAGYVNERRGSSRCKKAYFWGIQAYRAYALLKVVRPYLICKSEQADVAMALQDRISGRHGYNLVLMNSRVGGIVAKGSTLDKAEVEIREELASKLRDLNIKGPKRQEAIECLKNAG